MKFQIVRYRLALIARFLFYWFKAQGGWVTNIEKKNAKQVAKTHGTSVAKLGLRLDKVVLRLLQDLRRLAERDLPSEKTVLIAVTAPIRLPGKTAEALKEKIKAFAEKKNHSKDLRLVVHKNKVRLRVIHPPSRETPRLLGLVHNPSTDPKLLLDLMAESL